MKRVWFKAKRYGLPRRSRTPWVTGWYPATWQGWVVLIAAIFGYIWTFQDIDQTSHSVSDTLIGFVVPFCVITALLLLICYLTGEKPRWRWGDKD